MFEPDLLAGRATPQGTRRFAERFADRPGHFRCPDRLLLSSLAQGTRPGDPNGADDLLYRSAVPQALERGVNVFDTALSYRMQTSERSLGTALRRAMGEGLVARDEIYVISKGGYLTPEPERVLRPGDGRRELIRTYVDTDLVDPRELVAGNHSLEPAFLTDQIERSRANLGLETIDLYCVQDPELHLEAKGPDEFYWLLARVLEALEEAVARGAIGAYGLSTWSGLLLPHSEQGHLSIVDTFQLALEVGGADHHLRAMQLPYSVAMSEGMSLPTQFGPDGPAPVFETLRDTGCAVFASVPLARGRAVRGLPAVLREAFPGLLSAAQCALQFARSTSCVTSALVGMRRPEHIDENLGLARHAPAEESVMQGLFERAR